MRKAFLWAGCCWACWQAAAEDQRCVADVKLYEDGALLSERRINYFAKAIDIVVETIEQTG